MSEFVNRSVQYPNRKKIIVENIVYNKNGDIEEIIADVERNEGLIYEEGTELSAENLNEIVKKIVNNALSLLSLSDESIVAIDKNNLIIPTSVIDNFELPLNGDLGSTIEWNSSNQELIKISSSTAIVTRLLTTQKCILTATITKGNVSKNKTFEITVPYRVMTDMEKVEYDSTHIIIPEYVTSSFYLPTSGQKGSTIKWIAGVTEGVSLTADNKIEFSRSTYNTGVILIATFKYGSASLDKRYDVTIIGTDCFSPKNLNTSIVQSKGNLQAKSLLLTTTNLDGLYVVVENDATDFIDIKIENNDTKEITLKIIEKEELNELSGAGSYNYEYQVKVYLNSNHSLLLGTINGVVNYYISSTTPED